MGFMHNFQVINQYVTALKDGKTKEDAFFSVLFKKPESYFCYLPEIRKKVNNGKKFCNITYNIMCENPCIAIDALPYILKEIRQNDIEMFLDWVKQEYPNIKKEHQDKIKRYQDYLKARENRDALLGDIYENPEAFFYSLPSIKKKINDEDAFQTLLFDAMCLKPESALEELHSILPMIRSYELGTFLNWVERKRPNIAQKYKNKIEDGLIYLFSIITNSQENFPTTNTREDFSKASKSEHSETEKSKRPEANPPPPPDSSEENKYDM